MTVDFSLVIKLKLDKISQMLQTCESELINLPKGYDDLTTKDGYVLCSGDFWRVSTFNLEQSYFADEDTKERSASYQTLKVN